MAFIGNTPTQQAFTPAVDYFSGNGSTTAFTLSRPVASVAQVQVVIDNVAQNPSSAYTISGNTITFTSAPLAGTNNIYVYYTSPITQVIAPGQGTVNTTALGNITNIASGNSSLTLQTGSSPTTAVTIDTSQNVLVGTTTTTNNIRLNQKLAVVTTGSSVYGGFSNTSYNGTSAGVGPIVDFQRSRGTTDGSMTAVASGDTLGYMVFRGSDGTSFQDSSYITGQVDGSVTAGTVPGRLVFNTSNAERMRIDSSGNVGIGTSSPSSLLSIKNSGMSNALLLGVNASNSYYGSISFNGSNADGGRIGWTAGGVGNNNLYYDVPSSGAHIWRYGSGSTEAMRIDSSGNLLVGATSAAISSTRFSVVGSTAAGTGVMSTLNSGSNTKSWSYGPDGNGNFVVFNGSNTGAYIAYSATSWTGNSDERIKDIIEPITNAVEKVSTLRAVIGKFKNDEEGTRRSFLIAQDVQAVLPEAVDVQPDEQGTLGLRYQDVIPLLVASIKELKALVDAQATEIAELKAKVGV